MTILDWLIVPIAAVVVLAIFAIFVWSLDDEEAEDGSESDV